MCGIAGIVCLGASGPPPERDALLRMAGALQHRGPDESGIYRDERAGLAHTRLSIIDVGAGQQPLSNEDGSLWVVYNGEVFNYVELREELRGLGHRFRTESDTEVIVHAYEAWGDQAFARFNGQFALALWDARAGALVLARDRLGVRPLHLCEHRGRVLFGSEVKAIFAGEPSIPRALDPVGLEQTLTFWSVIAPRTMFVGVEELPPGHVRTYARGARTEHAFRPLHFPEDGLGGFAGTLEEATTAVGDALREATRLRLLRADVEVGCYVSGGLDSALVAALGRAAKGERLATFSLRFEDPEYDETGFQRLLVEQLGTLHHEVLVTRRDIAEVFPEVVRHAERPLLRTAPAPLYLLSRRVRDAGIKVVLTGEGADEVFAGYDLFREAKVRRFWARHPESTRRPLLLSRLYPYLARSPVAKQALAQAFFGQDLGRAGCPGFGHEPRWRSTTALTRLLSADVRRALEGHDARAELLASLPMELPRWSPLAQDQYLEMHTLLAGYILSSQGDRMLMAHSVEGRFPFLDGDVVDLAASLAPGHKLHVLDEKHVLKRLGVGLVPDAILRRSKQPYRAPDAVCFTAADAPPWVAEALSARAIGEAGVLDPERVAQLHHKCLALGAAGPLSNTDNMALTAVLSTQLLYEAFVARPVTAPAIAPKTVVERVGAHVPATFGRGAGGSPPEERMPWMA